LTEAGLKIEQSYFIGAGTLISHKSTVANAHGPDIDIQQYVPVDGIEFVLSGANPMPLQDDIRKKYGQDAMFLVGIYLGDG